jgi:Ser/Thr protein kinase RdoA (MazF antagonist)
MSGPHPYDALTPEVILGAAEALGLEPDGRLLALPSYENRVWRIGLTDAEPVVAKFYRPGRWSDAAILEEHAFARELADSDVPVAVPIAHDGATLHRHRGFRFALFPRVGGRDPELDRRDTAEWIGRLVARLHAVGARARFAHRATIDVAAQIERPARAARESALLPRHLEARHAQLTDALARRLDAAFAAVRPTPLRLHGDLHPGNLIWRESGPLLVDLDDCATGPAIADLYLLLTDDPAQRDALVEGYETFRALDPAEWRLVAPLRLMRQVHHAGWLAARWDDPAFPRAFPWAGEPRWWEEHLDDLARGLDRLDAGI